MQKQLKNILMYRKCKNSESLKPNKMFQKFIAFEYVLAQTLSSVCFDFKLID